ncbi:MAG: hypothetical protein IIY45_02840, partial [Firmicutes bacterium]|nr:hypothetical protein [Bacillota bacterium]
MTADDAISHGISFFMLHRQISLLRNLPVTPAKLNSLLYTITTDFSTIKKGTLLRQSALLADVGFKRPDLIAIEDAARETD